MKVLPESVRPFRQLSDSLRQRGNNDSHKSNLQERFVMWAELYAVTYVDVVSCLPGFITQLHVFLVLLVLSGGIFGYKIN